MTSFNTVPYDPAKVNYNMMNSIFIDGSNCIPMSGIQYYNRLFGNVMCSFAVDGGDSVLGGNVIISGDVSCCSNLSIEGNLWVSGDMSLNKLPFCSATPLLSNHLVNKLYVDSASSSSSSSTLASNNTWVGYNKFNKDVSFNGQTKINGDISFNGNVTFRYFPTFTGTGNVSVSNQFVTKSYVDSTISTNGGASLTTIQSNNNVFSGTNSYSILPTCTVVPSANAQFSNKKYVDDQVATKTTLALIQSNNNIWTGTNVFNTSLPTSGFTPTLANHLCTKTYVDTQVATKTTLALIQSNNNIFTGTNTFSGTTTFTGKVAAGDVNNYNLQYGDATSLTSLQSPNISTQAYANTAIGQSTLRFTTTGFNNTAVGSAALNANTTGSYNTAIGGSALVMNTTGYHNMAIGTGALNANSTGSRNAGVGTNSIFLNQTGNDNTAIGYHSLRGVQLSSYSQNVGIGSSAGVNMITGQSNTIIGYNSGLGLQNNTKCTCIGATSNIGNGYNQSTVIGYGATLNASNQILLGTTTETVSIPGAIKLNNTASIKGMACGSTYGSSNGTITISFGFTFTNIPVVTACSNYAGVAYTLSCMVFDVTTTSFKYNVLQFTNPTTAPNHFEQYSGVNWIAMGT